MSANPDAHFGQEIGNHVPPSEPMMKGGHKPGVKVGNDAVPEFHAETHTPGTAPADRTFTPNTKSEIPGQAFNDNMQNPITASDTLPGATSADVHKGLGHPGSGQTSQELHGTHKRVRAGLEGVGAMPRDPIHDQGADRAYETNRRGKGGRAAEDYPGAEDRENVKAEEVASERR
ncbi:hypothetical protein NLU13_0066 [Sarocladium strictum]|uniref:Uncharacterized protein n=1 Tax=Sarocladium strictum TaxID=5046 RepID=A0AA39GNE7_SARSR|nr:hypothetical protein NLU13_0066 [Sarocladium strictum]